MRRFHVHVSVDDIARSTAFYSKLFGEPARIEVDYVKWMVEDPRLNFAISKRCAKAGVNHLGIQVDSDDELKAMQADLEAADAGLVTETAASCCYAKSDKYWVTDPQGIAWETYHTLGNIPTFGGSAPMHSGPAAATSCCDASDGALISSDNSSKSKDCCT